MPHMFIAPSLFILGAVISYFIGSSWGTWDAGGSVTYQLIISDRAVFVSGTLDLLLSSVIIRCWGSML
nr:hypothetical protein P5646_20020 [Bacillus velezensis]